MKHSVQELIATAYELFPRGIQQGDPAYAQSPELLRQKAARIPASARYDTWRAMLRRLQARFPADQFPGVDVHNESLFLQSPTAGADLDRCYTGALWLPVRAPNEKHHELEFLVSFVVPYYVIYSSRNVLLPQPVGKLETETERSFDLSADEQPFARAIAEEIESTFPGHEPISPEVGLTVVPDVQAGNRWFGESTIFTCLFSDGW